MLAFNESIIFIYVFVLLNYNSMFTHLWANKPMHSCNTNKHVLQNAYVNFTQKVWDILKLFLQALIRSQLLYFQLFVQLQPCTEGQLIVFKAELSKIYFPSYWKKSYPRLRRWRASRCKTVRNYKRSMQEINRSPKRYLQQNVWHSKSGAAQSTDWFF